MTEATQARRQGRGSRPPVFHLGFTKFGSATITDAFHRSGYRVATTAAESVANDVFYAQRQGAIPLARYPQPDLFVDMETAKYVYRPLLLAYTEFAFLHRHYPDAYYVITLGDVDAWIALRYAMRGGLLRRAAAAVLDVPETELPAIWRRDWDAHVAACTAHFTGHDRFLALDDGDGATLADFVSPHYRLDLGTPPAVPPPAATAPAQPKPDRRARPADTRRTYDARHRSATFTQEVVEAATRSDPGVPLGMSARQASFFYARWDGGEGVIDRAGNPAPIAVDLQQERWPFLASAERGFRHLRTEGVLNEAWQLGARRGLAIDMRDARRFGTRETTAPDQPILTYCRLPGTANIVLWPLPGYCSTGSANYPGPESEDTVAFRRKRDTVVWRGNLIGHTLPELGPAGAAHQAVGTILESLGRERDPTLIPTLRTVPRYRMVRRLRGNPDFDLAITFPPQSRQLGQRPALRKLVGARLTYAQMYEHRYILSISGSDTGSNFLKAVDSDSVVLKEEDGWELFYTAQFKAWEHYIPLVRGGDDVEERLEWARANPRACRAMSQAARDVVRRLVHPGNREAYLRGILEVHDSRL